MADKKSRRLIVRELRKIHQGRTPKGASYTMWQVVATQPDGREIDQTLRTFEELPRNTVIEVYIERHQSEQYGTSFTLAQVTKVSPDERIRTLEDRVAKLEQYVYGSGGPDASRPESSASPPTPPPPASSAGSSTAPTAPPRYQRPPAPDEIPF